MGRKHGQGLVIYPNGNCFEGNWCDDLREGEGKYCIKQTTGHGLSRTDGWGRLIVGIWHKDVMQSGVISINNSTKVNKFNSEKR